MTLQIVFDTHMQFSPLTDQEEVLFTQTTVQKLNDEDVLQFSTTHWSSYEAYDSEDEMKIEDNASEKSASLPPVSKNDFQPYIPSQIPSEIHSPTQTIKKQKRTKRNLVKCKKNDYIKGSRSNSETGYRGVRFSTNGLRFRATVTYMKKPFNVGTFSTAIEAANAYDRALVRITNGDEKIRQRLNYPEKFDMIKASLNVPMEDITEEELMSGKYRFASPRARPKRNKGVQIRRHTDPDYVYRSDSEHDSYTFRLLREGVLSKLRLQVGKNVDSTVRRRPQKM